MSSGALEGLGVVGSRRLGCPGSQVRLSDPLPITSSSLQCSDSTSQLQPQFHKGAGFVRCGVRASGKGGHRDRASFTRVLQSPLCFSQSHRGLATGHRPLTPQRLGGPLQFSYGDCPVGSTVSPSGRLDGVLGSPGRLPPGSCTSGFSPLPEVLRGDVVFQFTTLCFGLSSAPQVFTRVMAPISSIMHRHGFRLLRYLDDWLVLGSTFQDLVRARDFLLWLCLRLGVMVNLSKSSLDPTQTLDYLGMTLETSPLRVSPTLKRVQKLSLLLHQFFSDRLQPVSVWRSLLGMMSSMSAIVPGLRLRMRSLQLRLNAAGRLLLDSQLVSWDDTCLRDLRWWSDDSRLLVGFYLGDYLPDLCLFSDASDQGWGAAVGDLHLSGLWSPLCSSFSINQRELLAILFAIRGFLPHLRGQTVAIYSDNSTALAYLRKQGGTHSSSLNEVAQVLLRLCEDQSVRLLLQFIPGHLNVLADSLSRRSQVLGSEWTLCHQAFAELLRRWPATIDLFATAMTHRLPVYFSPMFDPMSAGTDAMLQSWDGLQAYAFPPFSLIPRVLAKVRAFRNLELTLVAPFWP